jgi:SnoaL-like domain
MSTQRSSASDLGVGFVTALAQRDFPRLANTLTPDVRMRALIPPGPVEVSGAEAAAAKFSSWFADAEELELVCSGSDAVADRLHVFYRLRVKKPGDVRKIVEQHLLCAFDDDRITALDLVCSGFRPEGAGAQLDADQLKRN